MDQERFAIRLFVWMTLILLLSACQMIPEQRPPQQADAGSSIHGQVLWGTQPVAGAALNPQDATSFSPDLTQLDAMMSSLNVE